MKLLNVIRHSLFLLILTINTARSQELISTAGDIFSGSNVQLEWSLGEPVIDTYYDIPFILTEGFHQPEILQKPEEGFSCEVFPNPFDMFLIVKISALESENMYCQMIDVSGKTVRLIQNLKEYNQIITADMSDGIYLLWVFDSKSKLVKTVKIVKLYQV